MVETFRVYLALNCPGLCTVAYMHRDTRKPGGFFTPWGYMSGNTYGTIIYNPWRLCKANSIVQL